MGYWVNTVYVDRAGVDDVARAIAKVFAAFYFKWKGASRQRFEPCGSWDEYRAALRARS